MRKHSESARGKKAEARRKSAPEVGPTIGRIVIVAYRNDNTPLRYRPGIVTSVYPNDDGQRRIDVMAFGIPGDLIKHMVAVPHEPAGWLWPPYKEVWQ